MRKLKLYLDTSVISHIEAPHKPNAEAETWKFFRFINERSDEYELLISPVVDVEIRNCPGSKQLRMLAFVERMGISRLSENQESSDLANLYIEQGVLAPRHIRDLLHIAYATIARCDFVVSWNMKHLANPQTIVRANVVNRVNHYCDIIIVTPLAITGEPLDENT